MIKVLTAIEDAGLLLLIVLAVPVSIILVGGPIALAIRFLLEVVKRFL
jgi:hypothetical protein